MSLCQIYLPIVIGATKILKCFHSELICSVASDYHENNEVKDFLAQNFPIVFLELLEDLKAVVE